MIGVPDIPLCRAVFGGVMLVDVEIALYVARDVDQRVAAELLDHVIKEADAGADVIGAGPVEVHFDEDVGLVSLAGDPSGAHEAGL